MKSRSFVGFLALILLAGQDIYGQACCSAGPPILGSLELPPTRENRWQLVLTYEANLLKDVVSETRILQDDTRRRTVHSVLLEASYGFTAEFSVTALVSFVRQERNVRTFAGEESFVSATGPGDAVVLVKYTIVPLTIAEQRSLAFGLGVKIPLGSSSRSSAGILLPADLQPGTGAWDGIAWLHTSQGFLPSAPLTVFGVASYRWTGTNARYGLDQEGYRFGNEAMLSVGTGVRTDWPIDLSVVLRARQSNADRFGNTSVPNTGGFWLTVIPGVNVKIGDQSALRTTIQVPLYRHLTGTQLTTTVVASASLFVTIG